MIRTRSIEERANTKVVARVYIAMIDAFIELEMALHCDHDVV